MNPLDIPSNWEDDDPTCRDCGHVYNEAGDGYNGRCPDCADRLEAALDELSRDQGDIDTF